MLVIGQECRLTTLSAPWWYVDKERSIRCAWLIPLKPHSSVLLLNTTKPFASPISSFYQLLKFGLIYSMS
jgi:hypothetical protein